MIKFKNLITLTILFIILNGTLGCLDDIDNARCLSTVQKKYPNAVVYPLPDIDYRYIVLDSTRVRYVRVVGDWEEITTDTFVGSIE